MAKTEDKQATHRLVDHRPGERLLQVDAEAGRLIETRVEPNADATDAPFVVTRSVNGAEPKTVFSGERDEAGRVLDAIAGQAAKVRTANERILAVLAAIGLVATGYAIGGLYQPRGSDAPATVAMQAPADPSVQARVVPASEPPPVPQTIGGPTPAPSDDGSGIPPQAPPKTAASEPPRSTPPAIALPDGSRTAAAAPQEATRPATAPKPVELPKAAQAPAPEARLPSVAAVEAPKGSPVAQDGLAARAATAVASADAANAEARKAIESQGPEAMMGEAERLKRVVDMLSNGDKVTPEMVAQLPHEVAQRLRAAGVVLTPEEAATVTKATTGREFRIVSLPPAVVDRHRDADGIQTIPPANSWAATGGNVVIPLPGGGEIRSPDDLAVFGLQK